MSDNITEHEEFALRAVLGREIPPVPDGGFSKTVIGRVRLRIWQRRLILLLATAIGLIIALPPLTELLLASSNLLVELVERAEDSDALGQFRILLTMLPVRETVQAVSTKLANATEQMDTAAWIVKNQILVAAGLLALCSVAVVRLLER